MRGKLRPLIIVGALLLLNQSGGASEEEFETPTTVRAADFVAARILEGNNYKVDELARNDGYLNYYVIRSKYGDFEAAGMSMLQTRIKEVDALAELDDLSRTDVFIRAATEAGISQIESIRRFATRPVRTVVGIPFGIARMFRRYAHQAGDAVEATSDFVSGKEGETAQPGETSNESPQVVVDLTENYLGVSAAERVWAEKLGTDPYTTNDTLRSAIKAVSWTDRLGRFGMRFAPVPTIPGADIVGQLDDAVWGNDPYELQDLLRVQLEDVTDDEELIQQFLDNLKMTPSRKAQLVTSITKLEGASGRSGILLLSLNAETEAEAVFFTGSIGMLAWYHTNRKPLLSIVSDNAIPYGLTTDDQAVVTFATDHVYWTEMTAQVTQNYRATMAEHSVTGRDLWLLGSASERFIREISSRDFHVQQNAAGLLASVPN